MSRENENYRDVLEDLKKVFGDDRTFISSVDLARAEGCCVRTVNRRYGIPAGAGGIDRVILAKRKCQMAGYWPK